jgi:hypothetical protein
MNEANLFHCRSLVQQETPCAKATLLLVLLLSTLVAVVLRFAPSLSFPVTGTVTSAAFAGLHVGVLVCNSVAPAGLRAYARAILRSCR